ncbi:hypothetical protein [Microbacterium sp. NIBRBAC000506063]|uniref:hypothetical protein n=1 Tax=Microbacterium sp. NIBRBAC000506063 TaxID=2734618 RepID=UPI001BB7ED47|nr:hypothetical protein [Microbacterium sp. NIBRBAC000506063]QTV79528.1 hypothetical protein KAE78_11640 [Microbacterium sp. NIBRBAC000506063]
MRVELPVQVVVVGASGLDDRAAPPIRDLEHDRVDESPAVIGKSPGVRHPSAQEPALAPAEPAEGVFGHAATISALNPAEFSSHPA